MMTAIKSSRIRNSAENVLALAVALYVCAFVPIYIIPFEQTMPIILGGVLALTFMKYPLTQRSTITSLGIDIALAVAALAVTAYVAINMNALLMRVGIPNSIDLAVAGAALLLIAESTRRSVGSSLVVLGLLFIAYALFGQYSPVQAIAHRGYSLTRILGEAYLNFSGVYGTPLRIIVHYVLLFVILGSLLSTSGTSKYLTTLATLVAGRIRGGVGHVAVLASALMGSISGSAVANVATTGVVTIPAMKRAGFPARVAAAIEATASTGGQIMPPVMGAASFMIAENLRIPYVQIIGFALIPALLFFLGIAFTIYLVAGKYDVTATPQTEDVTFRRLLRESYLVLPLVALIAMLVSGYSPTFAGMWSIILAAVVIIATNGWRGLHLIFRGLVDSGMGIAVIVLAGATAGVIIGMIEMTGIGARLAGWLVTIAGDSSLVLLLLTMVVAIVLGMAMPTVVVYLLLVTLIAPALLHFGINTTSAHFFVLFFGILSMITPPVGLAAYTAASIAGTPPDRTGWFTLWFAMPMFILPYLLVYYPALLLQGTPAEIGLALAIAVIVMMCAALLSVGYLRTPLLLLERLLLVAAIAALIHGGLSGYVIGVAAFVSAVFRQVARKPRQEANG